MTELCDIWLLELQIVYRPSIYYTNDMIYQGTDWGENISPAIGIFEEDLGLIKTAQSKLLPFEYTGAFSESRINDILSQLNWADWYIWTIF